MIEDKLRALKNQLHGFASHDFNGKFHQDFAAMAEQQLIQRLGYGSAPSQVTRPFDLQDIVDVASADPDNVEALMEQVDAIPDFRLSFSAQMVGPTYNDGRKENEYSQVRTDGETTRILATLGKIKLNVTSPDGKRYPEAVAVSLFENWQPFEILGCEKELFPYDQGYVILHDNGIIQVGLLPNFVNNTVIYEVTKGLETFQFPLGDFAVGLWVPGHTLYDYPHNEGEIPQTIQHNTLQALRKLEESMRQYAPTVSIPQTLEQETLQKFTSVIVDAMYVHRTAL